VATALTNTWPVASSGMCPAVHARSENDNGRD